MHKQMSAITETGKETATATGTETASAIAAGGLCTFLTMFVSQACY